MRYPTREYQNDHRRRITLDRRHCCNDSNERRKQETAAKEEADHGANTSNVNLTGVTHISRGARPAAGRPARGAALQLRVIALGRRKQRRGHRAIRRPRITRRERNWLLRLGLRC
jgi:hypothetical protein